MPLGTLQMLINLTMLIFLSFGSLGLVVVVVVVLGFVCLIVSVFMFAICILFNLRFQKCRFSECVLFGFLALLF